MTTTCPLGKLGKKSVSSPERCPLFRVSFIRGSTVLPPKEENLYNGQNDPSQCVNTTCFVHTVIHPYNTLLTRACTLEILCENT